MRFRLFTTVFFLLLLSAIFAKNYAEGFDFLSSILTALALTSVGIMYLLFRTDLKIRFNQLIVSSLSTMIFTSILSSATNYQEEFGFIYLFFFFVSFTLLMLATFSEEGQEKSGIKNLLLVTLILSATILGAIAVWILGYNFFTVLLVILSGIWTSSFTHTLKRKEYRTGASYRANIIGMLLILIGLWLPAKNYIMEKDVDISQFHVNELFYLGVYYLIVGFLSNKRRLLPSFMTLKLSEQSNHSSIGKKDDNI